jgi:S1-C subfamily serine protease
VIVGLATRRTPTAETLAEVIATLRPGQSVSVDLIRAGGRLATVSFTVGKEPQ